MAITEAAVDAFLHELAGLFVGNTTKSLDGEAWSVSVTADPIPQPVTAVVEGRELALTAPPDLPEVQPNAKGWTVGSDANYEAKVVLPGDTDPSAVEPAMTNPPFTLALVLQPKGW